MLCLAVGGYGFWALAWGTLTTRALEAVMLPYLAGWWPRIVVPGRHAMVLLKVGIHVSSGALLWFAWSNADYAVVSKVVGPAALGYYALAFQLISLPVQKLTGNVNQAVYPLYCRIQHDRDRLRDWYLRTTALLSLLGMPVLGGMAVVADDAFALFLGEKWLPAVVPFQVLAVVGMIMTVSYSLSPLINALGRPDINLRYTILSTIILPSGFVILGVTYGLIGIFLAWLTLYPPLEMWIVHSTRQLTGCGVRDLAIAQLPVLMGVLAMAATTLLARKLFSDLSPAVLRLGATVLVGAVTYVGFMLVVARRTVRRSTNVAPGAHDRREPA
jgi:O-antigen/teichoic acid export membrane protein